MEADMKYELRNIKTLSTSDGIAWTASVYKDGKRIGRAEDRGDGGAPYVWLIQSDLESFVEWAREAVDGSGLWMEQFVKNTIKTDYVGGEKDGTSSYEPQFDIEMAIAYLMEIADLDKKAKKNMIFRVPNGKDPRDTALTHDVYQMKDVSMATATPRDIASALLYLTKAHNNAQVWDFRDHAWTDVMWMLDTMQDYLPANMKKYAPKVGA